ncbi:MAG: RagB/SusD family nutrient uptake outer membrane protein [Marinifilaceae bacterium]|nr:RagB/SusD family nutrient uptake outer membrane protein [Marinifilaceae bacterium]
MRKILYIVLIGLLMANCSDFLDQNPNPSGNKPINNLKDLELLLNNPDAIYGPSSLNAASLFTTDDYGIDIDVYNSYKDFSPYITSVRMSLFDSKYLSSNLNSWTDGFKNMYLYNTVLNTLNEVEGDPVLKNKLKAEALGLRAYYHFSILTSYAEWDSTKPGIGYVDKISEQAEYSRETVEYTLNKISSDIAEAEKIFLDLGEKSYDITKNWRMSYPALMSLKARLALYRGDYKTALESSNAALNGYNNFEDLIGIATSIAPTIGWPAGTPTVKVLAKANTMQDIVKTEGIYIPSMSWNAAVLFPSHELLDLFDPSDLRRQLFFENNNALLMAFTFKPNASKLNDYYYMSSYYKYGPAFVGGQLFTGPTVAEMLLIKAECLARKGQTSDAKNILIQIRNKRFADKSKLAVNNGQAITGSIANVLDERRRELPFTIRLYDLKRLNGLKADPRYPSGKTITRKIFKDADPKNPMVTYTIAPNSGVYALPIPSEELFSLKWQQNSNDGLSVSN